MISDIVLDQELNKDLRDLISHCKKHPEDKDALKSLREVVVMNPGLCPPTELLLRHAEVQAMQLVVHDEASMILMKSALDEYRNSLGYIDSSSEERLAIDLVTTLLLEYQAHQNLYLQCYRGNMFSRESERARSAQLDKALARLTKALVLLNKLRKVKITLRRTDMSRHRNELQSISIEV